MSRTREGGGRPVAGISRGRARSRSRRREDPGIWANLLPFFPVQWSTWELGSTAAGPWCGRQPVQGYKPRSRMGLEIDVLELSLVRVVRLWRWPPCLRVAVPRAKGSRRILRSGDQSYVRRSQCNPRSPLIPHRPAIVILDSIWYPDVNQLLLRYREV